MTATSVGTTRAGRFKQLVAASSGNLVEWYDWYTYTFLATYIAAQIFPASEENSLVSLLATFAVFAVGFFMRPLGGLVLGAYADRHGRVAALTLTILLMSAGSLLIAVLPTYAQIGVLAPVLLVVARLVQGLSAGGEFAAATTLLVESASPGRRGFFSSFMYVTTTIGQLGAAGLAALLAQTLSDAQMNAWGWRIPFAVGAVMGLIVLWIRRGADETHHRAGTDRPGLFDFVRTHPRPALLLVGITMAATLAFYAWTTFLPTYAHLTTGLDTGDALTAGTLSLLFFMVLQPLAGRLSDRVGRRPMLIAFGLGFTVLTVPLLSLLRDSLISLLVVQCVGMVFLSGYTAPAAAVNAELFPARVRAAGIGFPYSLTVALFGGTAPYVGTAFEDVGSPALFGWYVSAVALISTLVYIFAFKETKDTPLT